MEQKKAHLISLETIDRLVITKIDRFISEPNEAAIFIFFYTLRGGGQTAFKSFTRSNGTIMRTLGWRAGVNR